MKLKVNGKEYELDVPEDTPLLWAIREEIGFTGTKFGCGKGLCGACTVHLSGIPIRSCTLPVTAAVGAEITTIEGLGTVDKPHPVQTAWVELNVAQCGYCQCGQIMAAAGLLAQTPKPTDTEIDNAMTGNVCRCGTYERIRAAIRRAADAMPVK